MMQKIPLIFGRDRFGVGSWAIRLFTWSRWSHVGIIQGENVIEAVAGKGVIITPLSEFKARYSAWEVAHAPVADPEIAYDKALAEVGKGYDYRAIFALIFRQRWDNKDAWICSELYAHVSGIVRHGRMSRFTPEDAWKISR